MFTVLSSVMCPHEVALRLDAVRSFALSQTRHRGVICEQNLNTKVTARKYETSFHRGRVLCGSRQVGPRSKTLVAIYISILSTSKLDPARWCPTIITMRVSIVEQHVATVVRLDFREDKSSVECGMPCPGTYHRIEWHPATLPSGGKTPTQTKRGTLG